MSNKANFQLHKNITWLFSIIVFFTLLFSCNSEAKKQNSGDKLIKIDTENYSSRTNYGDNGEVLDIEDKIIDKIFALPEIKERAAYIKKETKGERHLEIWIAARPDENVSYYWVKAGEDNGMCLVTHFDFHVYPKTMEIKYYDILTDSQISLTEWRKQNKK